jgi:phage head maturation protease
LTNRGKNRGCGSDRCLESCLIGENDRITTIEGTAVVSGVLTVIIDSLGSFEERIAPGAVAHRVCSDVRLQANQDRIRRGYGVPGP